MGEPPRTTVDPPQTLLGALRHLGPGIVLASSIVGSGELIATTTTGAQAGFVLLWLILIGCVIKVAAQVEIGRATLSWGRTPLDAFDRVPGPRFAGRGWIYWAWVVMTLLVLVQQGGILSGVAQTLAAGVPVTAAGREWNRVHDEAASDRILAAAARHHGDTAKADSLDLRMAELASQKKDLVKPFDDTFWAVVTGIVTAVLLGLGRYKLIELVSIVLVGTFTLVTLVALGLLQCDPAWAISAAEFGSGFAFRLPEERKDFSPILTALATFGIIGVGASELMVYPYWCLEKGYGVAVGPRDDSEAWAIRARGWLRVMQLDAWASMAVYTAVTVAFYLLGAATLGRLGLVPEGSEMVRTLGAMYAPVFGAWANGAFLIGAFAVLYSTLFVAAAGNARMVVDGLILAGLLPGDAAARTTWNRRLSIAWPLVAMVLALAIRAPLAMVLASGAAQAVMLAALGVAVLWFRWRALDPRLRPGLAWDILLVTSSAGFIIIGLWTLWQQLVKLLAMLA